MMDQNKNNKRFLKCFLANVVIVIFICLIHVSGTLAQWSPYNNVGWASQPFFNSTFSPYNLIYNNSSVLSSFGGLGYRGSESIGNYINGGFNNSYLYGNFGNTFPSTFFSFPGSFSGGLYGRLYTGLSNYNTFYPTTFSPSITNTSLSPGLWTNPCSPYGEPTHEIKCEPLIDISLLEELTNLIELDLSMNTIEDISPLAKLTNLEKLSIHTTNTSDLHPLAGLTSLTYLDIHKAEVDDISPLAGLTNLETLELQSNNLDSGDCPDINALRSRGVSVTIWISDNFSCE